MKLKRKAKGTVEHLEEDLTQHALTHGFANVLHVGYDSPFAILLPPGQSPSLLGEYLRGYVDYVKGRGLPQRFVEDAMLDEDPRVPQNWEEMTFRYLTDEGKSDKARRRFLGDVIITDAGKGTYASSQDLMQYLREGGLSVEEFIEVFGFDPSRQGVALVNAHTPNREQRLLTQIHETIHGRDSANGLSDDAFRKNREAFEVLTDVRAVLLASPFLTPKFYEYRRAFEGFARKEGLVPGYILLTPENTGTLRDITSEVGDPRTSMAGILTRLREGLRTEPGIRDLLLHAPAFDYLRISESEKEERVGRALDQLILLEGKSRLPQVVPSNV